MGYLNKFATQAAYDDSKLDLDYPAISYINETSRFVFDKTKPKCIFMIEVDDSDLHCFINGTEIMMEQPGLSFRYAGDEDEVVNWVVAGDGIATQSGTYILTGDHTEIVNTESLANGVYIKYTDFSYSAYNSLESGKTPVGVALKTYACSLLLHPSEGENKQWSTNTSTQISGVTTTIDQATAKVDYAGRANTTAVVNSGLAGSAFTFATGAVYADGSKGWLPSCGEMEQIRLNATNINAAMVLIGGTPLDFESKRYWSSTQESVYNSWAWTIGFKDWYAQYNRKNTQRNCRAVTTI